MPPYQEWEQLSENDQRIISAILELLKEHDITPLETAPRLSAAEEICKGMAWHDSCNRPTLKSRPRIPVTEDVFSDIVIEAAWILRKHGYTRAHTGLGALWVALSKAIEKMGFFIPRQWLPFKKSPFEKHPRWHELTEVCDNTAHRPYE